MNGNQFASQADVTPLGDAWGEPLWRFALGDVSIEVHAADEAAAREAASSAYDERS